MAIVGAGAAGSIAAQALTEQGLNVTLLDAGPRRPRPRDTTGQAGAQAGPVHRALCAVRGQPIQARGILFDRRLRALFVDDRLNRYTVAQGTRFHWLRGRQVGGRLHTWARVVLRMSDHQFFAASRDGWGIDWPIDSQALAPHYLRVEQLLGIYGNADGVPTIPDSEVIGPWALTEGERALRSRLASDWPDRPLVQARVARFDGGDAPHGVRAAAATGRLNLRADTIAERIQLNADGTRATGVATIDARDGSRSVLECGAVLLCASTIETVRLLLNSACSGHERGLGNSSDSLGRYLMDHTMVYATGPADAERTPQPPAPGDARDRGWITGVYLPPPTPSDDGFLRSFGVQGSVGRERPAWALTAFGEVLPRADNRIRLDPHRRDAHGMPAARIEMRYGDNEKVMTAAMASTLDAIARAGGLRPRRLGIAHRILRRQTHLPCGALIPGSCAHEVGGARMGRDPAISVLDPQQRCWDVPNVYVGDGSCFVTAGFQNVSLTIMALAARACDAILDDHRAGKL